MRNILLVAFLMSFSSLGFAANIESMSKDQVTTALEGKSITTLPVSTMDRKLMNDVFMGYFDKDGKATGKFRTKPGSNPQKDTGTWTVKSDGQLCMTWQHWNEGKEFCLFAYNLNNSILFINTDNKLESLVLQSQIKSGNNIS